MHIITVVFLLFKVPGEINITAKVIGAENGTLSMAEEDNGVFNLVIPGTDILIFSKTFINLTWYEKNDMDIVDDYILSANVSVRFICFPMFVTRLNLQPIKF